MSRASHHSTGTMTLVSITMAVPVPLMPMLMGTVPMSVNPMVQTVMMTTVPKMDTGSPMHTMSLGASLRDRATLPSPLRGLGPSGGYPSRLRSRSLAARSACPAARCAHRRCRAGAVAARFDRIARRTAVVSSRRRCAPRSSGTSPRSPSPAAPAAGLRLGFVPGSTPCLAGAGCASHRLRHCAVHEPPRPCLRSCARSCGALRALRSASRRAPAPPPVRAPLPAAPSAPPAAHAPRRLPSAGFAGADSPFAHAARWPFPTARGRPRFSHPTHRWCTPATAANGCDGETVRGEESQPVNGLSCRNECDHFARTGL